MKRRLGVLALLAALGLGAWHWKPAHPPPRVHQSTRAPVQRIVTERDTRFWADVFDDDFGARVGKSRVGKGARMANYTVSGAGNALANGTYSPAGTYAGQTYYTNSNGVYLYLHNPDWAISNVQGGAPGARYYYNDGSSITAPYSVGGSGTAPAPTVSGAASDTTAPTFSSAASSTDGNTIDVTLTEAGSPPILPTTGVTGFAVLVNGSARTVSSAARKGSSAPDNVKVSLTLASPLLQGDTASTSYNSGNVTDSASTPNSMASFGAQSVTNNSTVLPVAPSGLTITPASDTSFTVNWTTDSTTSGVTYDLYESTSTGTETLAVAGITKPYTRTGRSPNTRYFCTVKAKRNGVSSAASAEANGYTNAGAPTAPSATAGNHQNALAWTAPTGGASTYNVKRRTGANAFANIATGVTGTSYTDTTAQNGTLYDYQITALGSNGNESAASTTASATPVLPAPVVASATKTQGAREIALPWGAVSGTGITYKIYRGTSAGGESSTPIASGVSGTSWSDNATNNPTSPPLPGVRYFYKIKATDAQGDSVYSNEVSDLTCPEITVAANGFLSGTAGAYAQKLDLTGVGGSVSGQGVTWAWTANNGGVSFNSSTSQTPTATLPANTALTLTATITDGTGDTATATVSVCSGVVEINVTDKFDSGDLDFVLAPNPAQTTSSYKWTPHGNISTTSGYSATINNPADASAASFHGTLSAWPPVAAFVDLMVTQSGGCSSWRRKYIAASAGYYDSGTGAVKTPDGSGGFDTKMPGDSGYPASFSPNGLGATGGQTWNDPSGNVYDEGAPPRQSAQLHGVLIWNFNEYFYRRIRRLWFRRFVSGRRSDELRCVSERLLLERRDVPSDSRWHGRAVGLRGRLHFRHGAHGVRRVWEYSATSCRARRADARQIVQRANRDRDFTDVFS